MGKTLSNEEAGFDLRFQLNRVGLTFKQSRLAYVATIFNSFLYVFLSWNEIPHGVLVSWFVTIYVATAIRWALSRRWIQIKDNPNLDEFKKMIRQITLGVTLSGVLWGTTSLFWLFSWSDNLLIITTFILAGMTAGVVAAYAAIVSAVYGFLTGVLLPFVVVLFLRNTVEANAMAVMATLYWILMMFIGRNASQTTLNAIILGLKNEDLMSRMRDASHEIRTPVVAIAGFSEIVLRSQKCTGEVQEYVKVINRNCHYLKRLVDNLLQYSQSPQYLKINPEWITLSHEMDSVVSVVEKMAKERNIDIKIDYAKEASKSILTDGLKFQQILINLLNNAIKFSSRGPVVVQVNEGRPGFLSIQIKDLGIGIKSESIPMLFKPFYRENRPEVRQQEGSGLGLALARKLAQALGGNIRLLDTVLGTGSIFEFEVPTGLVERRVNGNLSGRRILVVDDSIDIQVLFRNLFESLGASVTVCSDGQEAVNVISVDPNYDLILMDINMPVMDGYAATERIKKEGFSKPIVAFTAYFEKEKCLKFGFEGFVSKSESLDRIVKLVENQVLES